MRLRSPLKSLEYLAKRCYLGALTAVADLLLMRRRRQVPLRPGPRRVLVLRDDMVGDMVLATGMLRALKESHPALRLELVASQYVLPIVKDHPSVDRLICLPQRNKGRFGPLLAVWRAGPYDIVIDAMIARHRVKTRSILMMLASRAPWRIGFTGLPFDFVYNAPVPAMTAAPHIERMKALTGRLTAHVAPECWQPDVPLLDEELSAAAREWMATPGHGLQLLVNISASNVERRWSDDCYAQVLADLRRAQPGLRLLVIGLPADRGSAEQLAARFGGVAVTPTLRELLALVATADAVLTPDTAVTHMAAVWQRPVVSLMRRGWAEWAPTHEGSFPVYGPDAKVIAGLTPAQVVPATRAMLDFAAGRAVHPVAAAV